MEKVIWSEYSPDHSHTAVEAGGLDTAQGLLIGLGISLVFWLGLAALVF
jgi:hypothetical protein